jgi:hypothetical protein
MKLLIVSDIHGSLYYTKKLVDIYNNVKPDKILILGDILYHGPRNNFPDDYSPKDVILLLNSLKDNIVAVRGNCDAEVDQMVLDFDISKDYKMLEIDGYRFILSHGHINDRLPILNDNDILLNGHTHIYKLEKNYINPGSISLPKINKEHTFIIYDNKEFKLYDISGSLLDSITLNNKRSRLE